MPRTHLRTTQRQFSSAFDSIQLQNADALNPIAELDSAGNVRATFLYGTRAHVPDAMVMADGTMYRLVTDHLGSVRLVVNAETGEVVQRMDYDAFGRVLNDTNPGFQPFGFAGGLHDDDTGLVRFGARDYDAYSGKWTAKDPILFGGRSANFYEYAFSDAVNLIDATGALPWFATALIGAGIGGVYGAVSAFASGSDPGAGLAKGALVGFGIGSGAFVGTMLAGGSVGATLVFTSAGGAGGAAYASLTAQIWIDGEANEEELCKDVLIGATVPLAAVGLTLYATSVGYGAAEAGVAIEVGANMSGGAADLLGDATQEQTSR